MTIASIAGLFAVSVLVLLVVLTIAKAVRIVPRDSAQVVERLGRYHRTLPAGFHLLIPFLERIACEHSLEEQEIDIFERRCITRDDVRVAVDGVLHFQVTDPRRASYGTADYVFAISQIAQRTLRSEVGKMDLDRLFEERPTIGAAIVAELAEASASWGVEVLRCEIRHLRPPREALAAMEKRMRAKREKRMRAEREKRAVRTAATRFDAHRS